MDEEFDIQIWHLRPIDDLCISTDQIQDEGDLCFRSENVLKSRLNVDDVLANLVVFGGHDI